MKKRKEEKKIQPGVISNGDYYYYYIYLGKTRKKKKKRYNSTASRFSLVEPEGRLLNSFLFVRGKKEEEAKTFFFCFFHFYFWGLGNKHLKLHGSSYYSILTHMCMSVWRVCIIIISPYSFPQSVKQTKYSPGAFFFCFFLVCPTVWLQVCAHSSIRLWNCYTSKTKTRNKKDSPNYIQFSRRRELIVFFFVFFCLFEKIL